MGQVAKVLLLLAVVVPVTAYVAGSLAAPGAPGPTDHSPVILRDAPTAPPPTTTTPAAPPPARQPPSTPRPQRGDRDDARVVTPQPTPVGEDDDDEWDDDGPDDDDDTDDAEDDDGGDD